MSSPHKPCAHCGAEPMLQTSGAKARNKWARVQCSNYSMCGMQTPQITATMGTGLEWAKIVAWERWDQGTDDLLGLAAWKDTQPR